MTLQKGGAVKAHNEPYQHIGGDVQAAQASDVAEVEQSETEAMSLS